MFSRRRQPSKKRPEHELPKLQSEVVRTGGLCILGHHPDIGGHALTATLPRNATSKEHADSRSASKDKVHRPSLGRVGHQQAAAVDSRAGDRTSINGLDATSRLSWRPSWVPAKDILATVDFVKRSAADANCQALAETGVSNSAGAEADGQSGQHKRPRPASLETADLSGQVSNSFNALTATLRKLEADRARSAEVQVTMTARANAVGTLRASLYEAAYASPHGDAHECTSLSASNASHAPQLEYGSREWFGLGVGIKDLPDSFTKVSSHEVQYSNGNSRGWNDNPDTTAHAVESSVGDDANSGRREVDTGSGERIGREEGGGAYAGGKGTGADIANPADSGRGRSASKSTSLASIVKLGAGGREYSSAVHSETVANNRKPSKQRNRRRKSTQHSDAEDDRKDDIDDSVIENFIDELFSAYATVTDNKGRPLMNNPACRMFFRDFCFGYDVADTVCQADVCYSEEIERQMDMSFRFDLSKSEAKRGLSLKAFTCCMDQVMPRGTSRNIARGWFDKYAGDAKAMRDDMKDVW